MTEILVAYDDNGAIGTNGDLPWGRHGLPSDLKRFKALTINKSVIMGRLTFESIGRPLPNRENIVVSRDPSLVIDGATCVSGLEQAIKSANAEPIIIGGSNIYEAALKADLVETIQATEVHATFPDADTFFPDIDTAEWEEQVRESHPLVKDGKDKYPFDFVTYVRTKRKVS